MMYGLCVSVFIAGFVIGDYVSERRWKKAAIEALEVAAQAVATLRGPDHQG